MGWVTARDVARLLHDNSFVEAFREAILSGPEARAKSITASLYSSPGKTTAELTDREARLLLEAGPDSLLLIDDQGRIRFATSQVTELSGYEPQELCGIQVEVLFPGRWREAHRFQRAGYMKRPAVCPMDTLTELPLLRKDGTEVPVDISLSSIELDGTRYTLAAVRDISDQRRGQEALRASELQFRRLVERSAMGIFRTTVGGQLLECNEALARMLGYEFVEELQDQSAEGLYILPQDRERWLAQLRAQDEVLNREFEMRRKDGSAMWALENSILLEGSDFGSHEIIGTVIDLSKHKQLEQELEQMAYRDVLTGLPNRRLFQDRAEQVIALADRRRSRAALVYLGIRGFKRVNDAWGHDMGDRVLVAVANRLKDYLRLTDTVARLGGDEFAVLLTEVKSEQRALHAVERLTKFLDTPFHVEGHLLHLAASFGVAFYPDDATTFDELLSCADQAMYRASHSNGAGVQMYSAMASAAHGSALAREEALRQALAEEQLVLFYQPIVRLLDGKPTGAEALVRWNHPTQGLLPASDFITLAEYSGLVRELDRWVLSTAAQQAGSWRKSGGPDWISVNLSASSLADPNLTDYMSKLIGAKAIEGEQLAIELTERVAMRDPNAVAELLQELRNFGVQSAIDDFGTGHSTLACLKHFPVHYLKIDRSFVADLMHDPRDEELIRAIVGLAHGLGLQVIAEGVETQQQYEWLDPVGCDYVQGWYTGRPVPAGEL